MSFEIIKNLLLTLCLGIIFLSSSIVLYLPKSSYIPVIAVTEQADCYKISDKEMYICTLKINYSIHDIIITNQLVVNSNKIYKEGDLIEIEYDENNFLNISLKTNYKIISYFSSISGLLLLLLFAYFYNETKNVIENKIENVLNFIPKFL